MKLRKRIRSLVDVFNAIKANCKRKHLVIAKSATIGFLKFIRLKYVKIAVNSLTNVSLNHLDKFIKNSHKISNQNLPYKFLLLLIRI
jgi:hypothetical protein